MKIHNKKNYKLIFRIITLALIQLLVVEGSLVRASNMFYQHQKEYISNLSPKIIILTESFKDNVAALIAKDEVPKNEALSRGVVADCLRDLWTNREILAEQPIIPARLGSIVVGGQTVTWRRLHRTKKIPEGRVYSRETFRQDFIVLVALGFLEVRQTGGKKPYYLTEKLLNATSAQIDTICQMQKLNRDGYRVNRSRRSHAAFRRLIASIDEILEINASSLAGPIVKSAGKGGMSGAEVLISQAI